MVPELIVLRKCSLCLTQDVQDGLLTVPPELPDNKGAAYRNKRRPLQTGDEVTTVIIQIVLLKHDVTTSVAEHGVYVPII